MILYGVAAVIVLSLLPGCSVLPGIGDEPKPEPTQAEKVEILKVRLQDTLAKLQLQKAELKKLIHSEADLEILIRLMHTNQKKAPVANAESADGAEKGTTVTVDYLQMMTANQNTLKSDLASLVQELNALTADPGK
ncbi:MAG: hypothetical protein K2W88_07470 [Pararheinheimera sp.]|nr:hypothetical protein [Rheinheimera sp.]